MLVTLIAPSLSPYFTHTQHIEGLFSSDSCPNFCTCEFAENDCWYITFDSEEDTQKVPLSSLYNRSHFLPNQHFYVYMW